MADYIASNDFKTMEEIWDDILRIHWEYLDTEENMEKLKMRRKLEDELKEFLSIVQHDRKFFLIETAHVFKQSVLNLDQFSAYKALMGFEAISQYANNLFRKPWRKEYRCIKLYSGYYQHEVKANLVDAERMFEAMGYNLLSNHSLVLDGPICPDQVTNVSRDAMTAYVECQIMKQIFQGLVAMQMQTTWQEIYEFRETHVGTVAQAIKAMTYIIEKRRHRKHDTSHTSIAPQQVPLYSSVCNASSSHNNQNALCNNQRHVVYATPSNSNCSNSCGLSNKMPCSSQFVHHSSLLPHSKSLDHYNEATKFEGNYHHASRHSFDQSISPNFKNFDCVDGLHATDRNNGCHYSSIVGNHYQPNKFNLANAEIYNVSGNRHPLPAGVATLPFTDQPHHYSQNYDRSENLIEPNHSSCCHQNSHYDYLFNGRNSQLKSKNVDYSNCSFPSKQ